jgi:phage virion morphogenesis protein
MSGVVLVGDWKGFGVRLQHMAGLDFTAIHREIGEAVLADTLQAFRESKSPEGQTWPTLSERTILARLRGGRRRTTRRSKATTVEARVLGMRPLIASGRLRKSLTMNASATQAEIGTNLIYGAIHQFGGKAGKGRRVTIPRRSFLGLGQSADTVVRVIMDRLTPKGVA